jgi:hypothetical protein
MDALNKRAAVALLQARAEIMAWRRGLNHRNIKKAKDGATYHVNPDELRRIAAELQGGC